MPGANSSSRASSGVGMPAARSSSTGRLRRFDYRLFGSGGEPSLQMYACHSNQFEGDLLAAGVGEKHLHTLRDGMEDPLVYGYAYPLVTAVGRRPGTTTISGSS